MEYIITYGWAILIVLAVATILVYSGIWDQFSYMGNTANGFTTIDIIRFDLYSNGDTTLYVKNSADVDITINSILLKDIEITGIGVPLTLSPGEILLIQGNINYEFTGEKFQNVDLEFIYLVEGGIIAHYDKGTLSGKVADD